MWNVKATLKTLEAESRLTTSGFQIESRVVDYRTASASCYSVVAEHDLKSVAATSIPVTFENACQPGTALTSIT